VILSNKKAIVLGGTSGIGLATSALLSEQGANVTVAGRSPENQKRAKDALDKSVEVIQLDVLDRKQMQNAFESLAPLDIIINAATGGERATGPFLSMDLDGFEGSFRKLWGYVNSVRLGAPLMNENGSIVLVSGSPARKCPPGFSAISTVGNAVEGFCKAVAPEIAPVRINVISPGFIDTPMFSAEGDARDKFFQTATANNIIKRPGKPHEVAEAILFVVKNDFVTGTIVDVDGGALLP
tara:strand:- start:490 stop:1206 length:717 start_codon:yes stop_codon:yes gene_type:complete